MTPPANHPAGPPGHRPFGTSQTPDASGASGASGTSGGRSARTRAPRAPRAPRKPQTASAATGVSIGEIERVVAGTHHDPHAVLGAHPGPDGVVVRALRPLAATVTVVLGDGQRFPMSHVHQGVFAVTLPRGGTGDGPPGDSSGSGQ